MKKILFVISALAVSGCYRATTDVRMEADNAFSGMPHQVYKDLGVVTGQSIVVYAGWCSTAAENAMEEMMARVKTKGGNSVGNVKWVVDGAVYEQPSCRAFIPFVIGLPIWWNVARVQGTVLLIDDKLLPSSAP